PEPEWVRKAQAGSAQAFGQLVHLHQQPLRAFLRRLCGSQTQAADPAQEGLMFAWGDIARVHPARAFRAWLFGICRRAHRPGRRGWLRLLLRETAHAAEQETVTNPDPGLALDLAAATAQLPADQRAAVMLCLGLDFTHAEAAETLALPLGTVKSHVARGREKLA